jgi:hypothetical protein
MPSFTFLPGLSGERSFFVLLHTSARPDAATWNAYLGALRMRLHQSQGMMHVFVATDGGGPDAAQRQALTVALSGRDARTHVFTTDLLVRGIVTAFRWIGGSAIAYDPNDFVSACQTTEHSPANVLGAMNLAQNKLAPVATLGRLQRAFVSPKVAV